MKSFIEKIVLADSMVRVVKSLLMKDSVYEDDFSIFCVHVARFL